MYRVEEVSIKSSNYTLKITIFVSMWNFGHFSKIWYFVNYPLIEVQIKKFLLYMGDTYNLRLFRPIVKSHSVIDRSVFLEIVLIKSKNPQPFLGKSKGSNYSFTLIENKFRFFKIASFEFNVTIHYGLWAKCIQLWSLKNQTFVTQTMALKH